jgi:hypothetical protein
MLSLILTLLPAAQSFTDADYASHVEALRARLGPKFTVVVEKPFVVIGDGDPKAVERSAKRTVRWSVARLKEQYFARDPKELIEIYLFQGNASYLANAKALFGDTPTTPYGYYSPRHHALIMNIATGGGTLVHEIVHPFVEANIPGCPDWFNEGLGSLYEHSAARDGKIVGLPNWRLPSLQAAIKKGTVPSFETLTATGDDGTFYSDDPGTNYAQARYLLYYLQEKGLLQKYYDAFIAHRKQDPTGYHTLIEVLGEKDMVAFQKRWSRWVLGVEHR